MPVATGMTGAGGNDRADRLDEAGGAIDWKGKKEKI